MISSVPAHAPCAVPQGPGRGVRAPSVQPRVFPSYLKSQLTAQTCRRTAGSQHSRVAAQPGHSTAGSPHSRVAAQPGSCTAGSPHSRVKAQPGGRTAGSPHSRAAAAQAAGVGMLVGTPGGSRLAREPIVAFSIFFRKDRNVFLLFLSKSTFLFLGTCSCTPKSVPARSQLISLIPGSICRPSDSGSESWPTTGKPG